MTSILFCHDTYYCMHPDNRIYTYGAFPYALWQDRFLPHFDNITIIGRQKDYEPSQNNERDQSDGDRVNHILLPNINGPLKRLCEGRKTYRTIKEHVRKADGIIIRGPAEFGMLAAKAARALGKPYAVEMSGCAFDHSWHHGSLIGKLYAPLKYMRARHMVRHATQVIYVTQSFLQKRYPTNGLSATASNVEIAKAPDSILTARLQTIQAQKAPRTIGMIANYGNKLKGLHIALRALSKLKAHGIDFKLHVLGTGNPVKWAPLIKKLELENHVEFSGTAKGGDPVLKWLDQIDIYIQPSLHEGLPRAVIEAMSRGLPCLTSTAGGTSELLDAECLHKAGDANALFRKLAAIWHDKSWQATQATRNFKAAARYTKDQLAPIRAKFWQSFKARL